MIVKGYDFSLQQYEQSGFSGPVQGLTLQEADEGYQLFFKSINQSQYNPSKTELGLSAWHHKYLWAYQLATHPSIVTRMQQILGPDLVLWAMHFWYKEPSNEKFIPWHQDINYWPMKPEINATAWVSLGFSFIENGCLRILPGTHFSKKKHVALNDNSSSFSEGIEKESIDETNAIDLEMTPGQITFFNERVFHGSNKNTSAIPRVAFSVRYTTPDVKFLIDQWGGNKERIKTFLVSGKDKQRLNEHIKGIPPQT